MRPALGATLASVVLAAALGAVARPAAAQEPLRTPEVRALLSGFEEAPDADAWARLGPSVIPALEAICRDPASLPFVRLRALAALGAFRTERSRRLLLDVARNADSDELAVREALRALGRAFGPAAVPDVVPFLRHRSPVVREGAARALAAVGTVEARRALDARRAVETDPGVRAALLGPR
ncbi:MAG: HEAT repeat domain-containing protein [Sandaracinaceae bacterium]